MRLFRVIASALVGAVGLGIVGMLPARAEQPDETRDGSEYLASCLQTADTFNVLVLLDRSGSLAQSDPEGVRYEGLRAAFTSLAQRTGNDGKPIAVRAAVAAFDQNYIGAESIADWTRINGDDSEQAIDRVMEKTERKTFNPTGATNFHAALEGAIGEFDGRITGDSCNALLWFTDGEFFVGENVDLAPLREEMCRPEGLVDQFRAKGIVIIGLQLGEQDLDLKPMSIGEGDGTTCGTVPRPETHAPGIYLRADEAGTLKRVIGGISLIAQGCTNAGPSGVIDPGVRRMVVSIPTANKASQIRLRTPEGENLDVAADGGSAAAGYATSATADDGLTTVEITFPAGKGSGQWAVSADVPIDESELSFCVFSDLSLRAEGNPGVPAGPRAILTAQVVDKDGKPAAVGDFSTVVASATVVGADGGPRIADASIDPNGLVTVTFDAEPTDARVDVKARVELETASGLKLTPLAAGFAQQLMLNEDYPTLTPADVLDLGTAAKRQTIESEFTLQGSSKGPTKVCFDAVQDLVVPPAARGTTLDYEQGCVELAAGETRQVRVSMSPLAAAVGDGASRIPVQLHPIEASADAGAVSMEVPVRWRFEDPLNPWAVVLTTAIIALVSALVPYLALVAANWLAGRYSTSNVRYKTMPVTITGGGVDLSEPLTLTQLQYLQTPSPNPRHFEVDGLRFRSRTSPNPSTAPKFWVEPPAGRALAVSPNPVDASQDGSRASVQPGLGLLLVVHADAARLASSDAQVPGNLTVIVGDTALRQAQLKSAIEGLDVSALRSRLEKHGDPAKAQGATDAVPSNDDVWND